MSTTPTTAETGRLADDLSALSPTIIQQEILMSAAKFNVIRPLVRNFHFSGQGMTTTLPYMNTLAFETTAEAAEVNYDEPDVDADSVTVVKKTLDPPVSMEAADYGTGDIIQTIADEGGRAYAQSVATQIHTEVNDNGAAGLNVDVPAATGLTFENITEAYINLLAAKAPQPYYMVLNPTHYQNLLNTGSTAVPLLNLAGLNNPQNPEQGLGMGMRMGHYSGFEVYVDPYATTGKSIYFAGLGLWYAWKTVRVPGMQGELTSELGWERSIRSWVVSMTYVGEAKVRRAGAWAGNMYDVTP